MKQFIDKYVENLKTVDAGVDSVVFEQNGNVVEYVAKNCDLHELRSCSKLLIAFAYGIAIDKGLHCKVENEKLSLETKVYSTFKNLIGDKISLSEKVKNWTIKTLLTHSTGFNKMMFSAKEILENNIDTNNLVEEIFKSEIKNEPNTKFVYNNVEPYLLSVFFFENFGINISEFIKSEIFEPVGVTNFKWTNYGKYCAGATGLFLSYKDFHKIGKLLFNFGKWKNFQVVPKWWVEEMIKPQIVCEDYFKPERVLPKEFAGFFVWGSRDRIVFRDGSLGQYIICDYNNNRFLTVMSTEKQMNLITESLKNIL